MNVAVYIAVFVIILFYTFPAVAQFYPEIEVAPSQLKRIAFFPKTIPIYLYKDIKLKANYDVIQLRHDMIKHAQRHPYLEVVSSREIEKQFKEAPFEDIDFYRQAQSDMGFARNFMSNFNYESAILMLNRVIENYKRGFVGYYDAASVAQAYQLLAYAYIARYQEQSAEDGGEELSNIHPARLAFMELIRWAPYLTMLTGRQSALRVELYDQALASFLETDGYRQTPEKTALALAHKLSLDVVVMTRVIQDRLGGLYLELDIYDASRQRMTREHLPLDVSGDVQEQARDFIDTATAALDRAYGCLEPSMTDMSFHDIFYMDAGFLYHSYITYPTTRFPDGYGFYLGLTWQFKKYFFSRIQFEFSLLLKDESRTLYDHFEIYRIPLLVGFTYQWRWLRPYVALGLDLSFSAPYKIVSSLPCKTFGLSDIECLSEDVKVYRDVFATNLMFLFGLALGKAPFGVVLEFFIDATVYPTEPQLFKYPMGGHVGFQYQF